MPSRIDTRWSLAGLRAPILENRKLRVTVLPELGGRVYSIVYKPLDREMLWQNPRVTPRRSAFGAVYDDVWCGGWDENFPNDAPARIDGEDYPDHGETWSGEWEWQVDGDALRLWCDTPISGLRIEKRFSLEEDEARLHADYRFVNPGPTPFTFLWKVHAAFRAEPGWRVDLPEGTVVVTPAERPERFIWPFAEAGGESVDLRWVLPESACRQVFFYGTELVEGWCTVTDPAAAVSAGMVFDPGLFRACWVFASYGGWRRHQVVVLEPATGYPGGPVRTLEPGRSLDTRLTFQVAI